MITLVYVSSATKEMSEKDLLQILEKSRGNNSHREITGMLLYKGGNFMQALEGPPEQIAVLMERIERDPRHRNILVLLNKPLGERHFKDWTMGFSNLDKEAVLPHGTNDFLGNSFTSDYFKNDPSQAQKLLMTFRNVTK